MAGAPSPGPGERIFDPDLPRVDVAEESLTAAPTASAAATPEPAALPCAVFWLDLSGRITRWSGDCGAVFGRAEVTTPEHFSDLFTADDRSAGVPGLLLRQVSETGSWEGTGVRVHGSGALIRVGSSITRVRTPNGLDIGFMVVTRDISRSPGERSALVGESAARMASLGRVASDVSHDVQSILTAIRGFAGALERHLPASGAGHHLWLELLKACDRGTDVTRRLLGTGRPNQTEGTTADVREIVSEIEPLLRQVVPARIDLAVSVDAAVPHVRLRPSDLELVLLNLVINARDSIDREGLITIEARRAVGPEGRERVVLSVGDSGHGMTAEVRARCLEREFTTKARGAGSGLGLALVRSMVDQAHGSIEIDSKVGDGTTMTLILDAAETELELLVPPMVDEDIPGLILLYTAAPGTRLVVASQLRRQGWRVASARNEADFVEFVGAAGHPSLVIVDDETGKGHAVIDALPDDVSIPVLHLRDGRGGAPRVLGRHDRELAGAFEPHELVRVVAEMLDANADRIRRSVH